MKYDVIVIGGGHAGIEAAYASAKSKLSVILITGHVDLIGQMSCNPSIGGVAKGNIVREIDALGGTMAKNIDSTGIHFKMLNQSKGMAVWGNRAQADKVAYRRKAKKILESKKNISLFQGYVRRVVVENEKAVGVILDSGCVIRANAVILANGTFLNGVIHIGLNSFPSGRLGEPPSESLTSSLIENGIKSGRLKTGTSPRLDGTTIDYSKFINQRGDDNPWPFSFSTERNVVNKRDCWIGKTNSTTHKIILDNLDKSPLYSGIIKSIGPKYCPSIEDKIVRFGEREGHSLFLEPESIENNEIYINGFATSLPFEIQIQLIKSIPGLENTKIIRPAYAVEYDYFQPTQLYHTLESRVIKNLYFAGQINGTSGYEEAACQGLIAGVNAAQKILGKEELVLGRDSSYIGVLLDDLVTKGTEEPYRMFTSRAEYRILLRQDNADERLMPIALNMGLISKKILEKRRKVWDLKDSIKEVLNTEKVKIDDTTSVRLNKYLLRPEVSLLQYKNKLEVLSKVDEKVVQSIEADIKYEGFEQKEKSIIESMKKLEKTRIPVDIDYLSVKSLLIESRKKLNEIKPLTLGQVSRISGITPADIYNLAIYITNHHYVSRETSGN